MTLACREGKGPEEQGECSGVSRCTTSFQKNRGLTAAANTGSVCGPGIGSGLAGGQGSLRRRQLGAGRRLCSQAAPRVWRAGGGRNSVPHRTDPSPAPWVAGLPSVSHPSSEIPRQRFHSPLGVPRAVLFRVGGGRTGRPRAQEPRAVGGPSGELAAPSRGRHPGGGAAE